MSTIRAGKIVIDLTAGTTQFVLDMDKANAKIRDLGSNAAGEARKATSSFSQLNDSAKRTGQAFGELGTHGVSGVQATSAALRVMEGNMTNNLRAAERFLANTLHLGSVLQGAFPVVGGIALLGVLTELGKKAYDAYQAISKMGEAPQRLKDAFRELNQPLAIANDELRVTNDRLDEEIAKLQGKPGNGLITALDEARLMADRLAESLDKDLSSLEKLLREKQAKGFEYLLSEGHLGDLADQVKDFRREVGDITGRVATQIQTPTKPGLFGIQVKPDVKDADAAIEAAVEELRKKYLAKIVDLKSQLPRPGTPQGVALDAGVTAGAISDTITNLTDEFTQASERLRNLLGTQKKGGLEGQAAAESLTRPYQNKLHELDAQLAGLKDRLASIGKSATAEVLAQSMAKAKEEIAKLNDELAKHHQHLTQHQQDELTARYTQLGATQAEVEWKTKLDQATTSIGDRIASLNLLTAAIGQGYEAQKRANVETQLAKELGEKANDPEWMRTHAADVAGLRGRIGSEYDAQRTNKTATTLDQLSTQIELENSLATAEVKGAEAVRQATLEHQLSEIAKNNSADAAKKLIAAETELSDAQQKVKAASTLAQLQQEIEATDRLTAAQLGGAEAVRRAQLQNRIADIRRNVPAQYQDQQIAAVTKLSEAQHQQEILSSALKTGQAYQDRLDSLDQEIAALQQIKGTKNETLATDISLNQLEKERAKIWSDQAQVLGSARDGLKAYFAEMATDGVSAAAEVHDALKTAFDSLNDNLAKLVAGQKVNWASLFQSISADLLKASLRNAEAQIAGKFFPPAGQAGRTTQQRRPWDEHWSLGPIAGGKNTPGIGTRDGQSAATSLFVTTTDATTAANPAPSTSAVAAPPNASGELSKLLSGATGFLRLFGGFRADGGSADAGMMHVVGENGPEVFIPGADGAIMPNHLLDTIFGKQLPKAPFSLKYSAGNLGPMFGQMAVGVGLGLLSRLFHHPTDHHFKPGNAYTLPNWSFGGYRAAGGPVDPGSAYMVGEQGPELWTPPATGGSIVSNDALTGRHRQGGDTYIDARGTDPAHVEQRVRQGMIAAHNGAVRTSFKSYTEYQKRRPEGVSK